MNFFCSLTTFKSALEKCIELTSETNLSSRGIDYDTFKSEVENLSKFLGEVVTKINDGVSSYGNLLEELQNSKALPLYKLTGFLGKILDVVQVVKPGTLRNKMVIDAMKKALTRTGHEFLLEEVKEDVRNAYFEELISATATFNLLEVVFYQNNTVPQSNPISTLRMSMGYRLPEEYFAELLAGWLVEDAIKYELEKKGLKAELTGVDNQRKVLFSRQTSMGDYDLKVEVEGKEFSLEVQRVGKLTKKKDFIKTALKSHKYEKGDDNEKILVLWIGKNPSRIAETYSRWFNHLIFIPNLKHQEKVTFSPEGEGSINFDKTFLDEGSLSWGEFKEANGERLKSIFEQFAVIC